MHLVAAGCFLTHHRAEERRRRQRCSGTRRGTRASEWGRSRPRYRDGGRCEI